MMNATDLLNSILNLVSDYISERADNFSAELEVRGVLEAAATHVECRVQRTIDNGIARVARAREEAARKELERAVWAAGPGPEADTPKKSEVDAVAAGSGDTIDE